MLVLPYIREVYPNTEFSEFKYLTSDGKDGIVFQDWADHGAQAIVYHYLYMTAKVPVSAPVIFTVEKNVPLISMNENPQGIYFPIPLVRKATYMKVICSDPHLIYTVCYQFLFKKTENTAPGQK